jgi:hypothetical protein
VPISIRPRDIISFVLDRISKYQENAVYIYSLFEDRYISTLVLDSEGVQTSVIMSQRDRSLFTIQAALDQTRSVQDPLSIHLSFLSLSTPNSYLRHFSGRIRLSKFDNSDIFRQDATFKLIETNQRGNSFSLESTNLPQLYMCVDTETKAALVLTDLQTTGMQNLNETFLFRFLLQY